MHSVQPALGVAGLPPAQANTSGAGALPPPPDPSPRLPSATTGCSASIIGGGMRDPPPPHIPVPVSLHTQLLCSTAARGESAPPPSAGPSHPPWPASHTHGWDDPTLSPSGPLSQRLRSHHAATPLGPPEPAGPSHPSARFWCPSFTARPMSVSQLSDSDTASAASGGSTSSLCTPASSARAARLTAGDPSTAPSAVRMWPAGPAAHSGDTSPSTSGPGAATFSFEAAAPPGGASTANQTASSNWSKPASRKSRHHFARNWSNSSALSQLRLQADGPEDPIPASPPSPASGTTSATALIPPVATSSVYMPPLTPEQPSSVPAALCPAPPTPANSDLFLPLTSSHGLPFQEASANPNNPNSSPPLKRKRPPMLEIPPASPLPPCARHDLSEDALSELAVEGAVFAVASKRGRHDCLEDAFRAIPEIAGDPSHAVFGIFDGHGGRLAADYAAEHLGHNIIADLAAAGGERAQVEAALRGAYLRTDADFLNLNMESGTSCVTAVVREGQLWVAHAGDCRAVLSDSGVAQALTDDHRARREDEQQRVESLGGHVQHGRVQGVLAISRAIGDRHHKDYVCAEPDTAHVPLSQNHEFLILASDGLWDYVSNQEAVDIARPFLQLHTSRDASCQRTGAPGAGTPRPPLGDAACVSAREMFSPPLMRRPSERGAQPPMVHGFADLATPHPGGRSTRGPRASEDMWGEVESFMDSDLGGTEHGGGSGLPLESPLSSPPTGLVQACQKLVSLAVSERGSLDDVTVMIVLLQSFRQPTRM